VCPSSVPSTTIFDKHMSLVSILATSRERHTCPNIGHLSLTHTQFQGSTNVVGRLRLKCDGTRAETRFRLSAKRTSPFKSAEESVQSTTGSRDVRISGSNAGYTMFQGSVKGTGYPLHSPVSTSLPLPCVNVCHHISTGFYPAVVAMLEFLT